MDEEAHADLHTKNKHMNIKVRAEKNKDMVIIFNRIKSMKHGGNDLLNYLLKAF